MARKTAVVLNREALSQFDRGLVEGLERLAEEAIDRTDPPDAAPYGVGLVEGGGYISYLDGKKVGGTAPKKPTGMRVRGQGAVVGLGFGFPGRFQETGTVNHPPQPFFAPTVVEAVGDRSAVEGAIRGALSRQLASKARRIGRMARS